MSRKQRYVLAPLAQRRQADLDRIQAIQQVFSKVAGVDFIEQLDVGSRKHAHVDSPRARGADALQLAGLQNPEELGLLFCRNVGDLIEKQGAAVGELEVADAIGACIGERALDVAEQLALEDAIGDGADIYRNQRTGGAIGGSVDPSGHNFFTGPMLASNQDVGIGRRHSFHELEDRQHDARLGDQLGQPLAS